MAVFTLSESQQELQENARAFAEGEYRARERLLGLLASEIGKGDAAEMAFSVAELDPTPDAERHAREKLLRLLTRSTDGWGAAQLIFALARLDLTRDDEERARELLLELMAETADTCGAESLLDGVVMLSPTIRDLMACWSSGVSPSDELLAAVRQNSTLDDWLGTISYSTPLSDLRGERG